MTFTKPAVGPKVYLSRGPSGHNETFTRAAADKELAQFLGCTKIKIAVDGFIRKVNLACKPESWSDVICYLGELVGLKPDHVPLDVAVAFWANVDQTREANKRASAGN